MAGAEQRQPTDEDLRARWEAEEAARAALPRLGKWDAEGGAEAPPADAEYVVVDYFGTEIRVVNDPLSLELTFEEFIDEAEALEGVADPRAVGSVRRFLRRMIHEADFVTFWGLVRKHRQDITKQMEFAKWLLETVAGYPTQPQSDSPAGQSPAVVANSAADVSWRAQQALEAQGRPDLALAVVRRREHVEGSGG
jgi:hypothetical protein